MIIGPQQEMFAIIGDFQLSPSSSLRRRTELLLIPSHVESSKGALSKFRTSYMRMDEVDWEAIAITDAVGSKVAK